MHFKYFLKIVQEILLITKKSSSTFHCWNAWFLNYMISLERVYETKSRKRKIQQTQIGNHWRVRVPMAAGHSISKITLSFDPSISVGWPWHQNIVALASSWSFNRCLSEALTTEMNGPEVKKNRLYDCICSCLPINVTTLGRIGVEVKTYFHYKISPDNMKVGREHLAPHTCLFICLPDKLD